jgi:A/G-specific adenine glycosylase
MAIFTASIMARSWASLPKSSGLGVGIAEKLLSWYRENQRELPWRQTRDPYAIWVSEIMLHQTQVTTALPYYRRFLARFPTVFDLAQALLEEVLKAWEGLGYYARARNMHCAAQSIVAEFGGRIPDGYDALRRLPGIGDYTAGAILSIAFGQDRAAVDGNVLRVLSRVLHVTTDIADPATKRQIETLAAHLLPPGEAGDFNQALMDLGATVCLPRRPRCLICPLPTVCAANQLGIQELLPVRAPKKPAPHYQVAAAVIWRNGQGGEFLIAQRLPKGLLGGLWEFPGGKQEAGESLPDCLKREIREELGFGIAVGDLLVVVEHAYTHFRITMHTFHCCPQEGEPQTIGVAAWRWIMLDQVGDFAFSAADHKIIAALK